MTVTHDICCGWMCPLTYLWQINYLIVVAFIAFITFMRFSSTPNNSSNTLANHTTNIWPLTMISRYNSGILSTVPMDGNLLANPLTSTNCYCHSSPHKCYCDGTWTWGRIIFYCIVQRILGFVILVSVDDYFHVIIITPSFHANINVTSFISSHISTWHPTIRIPFSSFAWIRNSFCFVTFMSFTSIIIACPC